jgi:hypothetical protein
MFKPTSRFAVALLALSIAGASSALADCSVTGTDPVPICRNPSQADMITKSLLDSHLSFRSENSILKNSLVQAKLLAPKK